MKGPNNYNKSDCITKLLLGSFVPGFNNGLVYVLGTMHNNQHQNKSSNLPTLTTFLVVS